MKTTKMLKIFLPLALIFSILTGCVSSSTNTRSSASNVTSTSSSLESSRSTTNRSSIETNNRTRDSFANSYGTSSTVCAHSGCTNYIASSGDTNCCATHANKCLNCGAYIDEDAMYCMDCLRKAASSTSSSSKSSGKSDYSSSHSSSNTGKSSSSTTGAGGYDMPNENDKSFSDYVKRVDPELYESLFQ